MLLRDHRHSCYYADQHCLTREYRDRSDQTALFAVEAIFILQLHLSYQQNMKNIYPHFQLGAYVLD
jgi:hypothetical protein